MYCADNSTRRDTSYNSMRCYRSGAPADRILCLLRGPCICGGAISIAAISVDLDGSRSVDLDGRRSRSGCRRPSTRVGHSDAAGHSLRICIGPLAWTSAVIAAEFAATTVRKLVTSNSRSHGRPQRFATLPAYRTWTARGHTHVRFEARLHVHRDKRLHRLRVRNQRLLTEVVLAVL